MTTVTVKYNNGIDEDTIQDPGFVQTLCNVNKATIDGTIYHDVAEVTYGGEE